MSLLRWHPIKLVMEWPRVRGQEGKAHAEIRGPEKRQKNPRSVVASSLSLGRRAQYRLVWRAAGGCANGGLNGQVQGWDQVAQENLAFIQQACHSTVMCATNCPQYPELAHFHDPTTTTVFTRLIFISLKGL